MSNLDQGVIDGLFRALAAREGDPIGRDGLAPDLTEPVRVKAPEQVRDLFAPDYVDLSGAAADHGFAGMYVGVSDELWEKAVSQGSPSAAELDCRMAMLMAALRVGAVGAMTGGENRVFVWVPEPGEGRARRMGVALSYMHGEHQVLLADAAPVAHAV